MLTVRSAPMRRNTCGTTRFKGKEVTPEEMAKLVVAQADEHQWLDDDLPEEDDGRLPFNGERYQRTPPGAAESRKRLALSVSALFHRPTIFLAGETWRNCTATWCVPKRSMPTWSWERSSI